MEDIYPEFGTFTLGQFNNKVPKIFKSLFYLQISGKLTGVDVLEDLLERIFFGSVDLDAIGDGFFHPGSEETFEVRDSRSENNFVSGNFFSADLNDDVGEVRRQKPISERRAEGTVELAHGTIAVDPFFKPNFQRKIHKHRVQVCYQTSTHASLMGDSFVTMLAS